MLNGELYIQRFHKLIYLCLSTDCFMTISLQMSEQTHCVWSNDLNLSLNILGIFVHLRSNKFVAS